MKYIIAAFFLFAAAGSMADKPAGLPGNNGDNGNHYAYGKDGSNGNHFGNSQRAGSIPEAGTLALIGLGLAGLIITRTRRKQNTTDT